MQYLGYVIVTAQRDMQTFFGFLSANPDWAARDLEISLSIRKAGLRR
jgi:hypothetical protein